MRRCSIEILYDDNATDYTSIINSPDVSKEADWQYNNVTGNQKTNTGNGYDGESSNRYHNSWNKNAGGLRYTAWQTLSDIPNGTYEFKVMCRVMGATIGAEGYYTYAIADNDTANAKFRAVHTEQINLTKYEDPYLLAEDGSDSLMYITNTYGSVWTKAMDDTNMGEDVEPLSEEDKILSANAARGYGWQWNALIIEVQSHQLTIGVTCDSLFTHGHIDTDGIECIPFSGNQISADNYTLTLIQPGNNEGWKPIAVDVKNIICRNSHIGDTRIYNLAGLRVKRPIKGNVYIINGKKVLY